MSRNLKILRDKQRDSGSHEAIVKDDPPYVTLTDCEAKHKRLELAIFGEDGRGGMVRDIQIIKTANGIFRTVVLPIIISVVSAAIIAYTMVRG